MIGEKFDRLGRFFREDSAWRWEATLVCIVVIVFLGGVLRFHGLNWDYPPGGASSHQHPDERFLSIVANDLDWPSGAGEYFDTANSPANPYNLPTVNSFVYGTLPLYLVKGAATLAGDDPAGPGNSYDTSTLWGRRLSALVSTASIALVFLAGLALFGRGTALLGSLLYALAVLPVQLAHFWTVDPYVTFFGLVTILLSALLAKDQRPSVNWAIYAGIGVAVGLGMASKVAFWPLILVPVIETAMRIGFRDFPGFRLRRANLPRPPRYGGEWMTDLAGLLLAALISLVLFRLAQPNAFVGPGLLDIGINTQWWNDLTGEASRQSGFSGLPWVIQFADRPPYLESLKNMVFWGMGPTLGIAAWSSVAAGIFVLLRTRDTSLVVPVVLPLVFLFYFGGRFVVFMRYFEPVYPLLCLLAAWGLLGLARKSRHADLPEFIRRWAARSGLDARGATIGAAGALTVLTVLATAWWSFAFQNVYSEEHPRIQATRWIFDNVEPGAGITNEIWDDAMPMALPGYPPQSQYRFIATEPYEPDSVEKVGKLIYGDPARDDRPGLEAADYVVLASDRVRLSVPRLERKYPAMIRYYELLDSGGLGFELVQTFSVRPSFLGISIDDSGAEESFSVYDHPTVRIYRKTADWNPDRAADLLLAAYPERAVLLLPGQGRTNGLLYKPEEARQQQEGGTFSDVFNLDSPTGAKAAVWWFFWLELSALAAIPLTVALFRWLPDRGFALTKLLGPLAVALAVWLLVAWNVFDFSQALAVAVFTVWLCAGAVAISWWRAQLFSLLRSHWRVWLTSELVFVSVFLAFLTLRAWNPDLWHPFTGGEKPMDLAYLTAVSRSTEMPPYDPWFGGGSMNYYYWGWFFLAVPIRALRLLPEVAFNLGIPTYAAIASAVAFSTVHNLAALSRQATGRIRQATRGPITAGLLGVFLLVFAGNLDGIHQTVERFQRINTWGWLDGVPVAGGAVGIAGGLARFATGTELPPYDWWRSARIHFGEGAQITEFPYWSFTFADLHPHLMALPFLGLILALALGCVLSSREGDRRRSLIFAALLGLGVGLIRAVHTWDLPTAGIIAMAGIVIGQMLAPGGRESRAGFLLVQLLVFAAFLLGPMAPYSQHTEIFDRGMVSAPERTPLYQHFAQFGVFTIIACAYLAVAYSRAGRVLDSDSKHSSWQFPYMPGASTATIIVGAMIILLGITWRSEYATAAFASVMALALLNLAAVQWLTRPRDVGAIIATGLFVGGFAIAGGVDLITLKGDIGRMNTVFKFYMEAWQLFALASAFAIWYMISAATDLSRRLRRSKIEVFGSYALAGTLLLMAAIFLVSGTPARIKARFPHDTRGFDGLAYIEVGRYSERDRPDIALADDLPLIEWLRKNVEGSPIIVEAVGPLYSWDGRISITTGLPAVIGWDNHQNQQRGSYSALLPDGGRIPTQDLVAQRRRETEEFYRSGDVASAEAYLRKYNVGYVIVGTEEAIHGTPEGLARLEDVPALTEVFRSGEHAIYAVDQELLPAPVIVLATP